MAALMEGVVRDDANDNRVLCKYGGNCYQKNPDHHKRFKHPPKRKTKGTEDLPVKKMKSEPRTALEKDPEEVPNTVDQTKGEESRGSNVGEDVEGDSLPSPADIKENIRQKFLLEMPEDFFSFWEFCESLKPQQPADALQEVLNVQLVGPFDVLSGKLKWVKCQKQSEYLRHWRYYYDPPEFQTVLKGDEEKEYHMGYFRDDPNESPVFVGASAAAEGCKITAMGENLFGAVNCYVTSQLKTADVFRKTKLQKLQHSLQDWARSEGYSIEQKTGKMRARDKKVVTKSFHGAGIVVPYDKKTEVGYREIPETDANLKKILKKIAESKTDAERDKTFDALQEIITNVQFANDEGDPGMGLELGIDVFCYGGETFHSTVTHLLSVAYDLLGRNEFATIMKAHLKDRRRGSRLSVCEP